MSNGWNLYSLRYSIDQIRTKIIIYKQIDNTKTNNMFACQDWSVMETRTVLMVQMR